MVLKFLPKPNMAMLGIDYGAKKIGLAKSDDAGIMAMPLEVLRNTGEAAVQQHIKQLCDEQGITTIVVGVPVSLSSGSSTINIRDVDLQNKQMQEVLAFIEQLKTAVAVPVVMEDERLSTQMANRLRRDSDRKGSDDDVAAMLILQNYLDKLQ